MASLHIKTPLFESRPLSLQSGKRVWLKFESMQPSGSFKIRGIGLACEEYSRRGARRFISSSGGNAGIAAAYAGRHLGVPVVVVVPETTSDRAKELIENEGAEVVVNGASWQEANKLALSMLEETDFFVHPFDDPLIWRGHASMVDEIVESGVRPDVIVLSVGGGGLLCGVIEGLRRNDWADVPVIAVETEGAACFAQSVYQGYRVELSAITSLATSLGARQVCEQAFKWSKKYPITNLLVSDKSAISACESFASDHRVIVEPACGAALSAVYESVAELRSFDSILVIVCGGATTTIDQMQSWSREFV
ncbi:MAG: pyridoxal-phosphate dependent enzyme [Gammaproteobacteria bacterium]|nr:pyridoxal-phosphate dependent enzyme [Gammaproteobacteria bacterium]